MSTTHRVNQPNGSRVTEGGREYVDRVIRALTPTFLDDPVYRWLLHQFPASEREAMLSKLFSAFLNQGALNDGVFVEVADFAGCGLLMPPGSSVDNPLTLVSAGLFSTIWQLGLGTLKRCMFEYGSAAEPLMKKAFTKEEMKRHWYVFIMGTASDHRRQGYATELLVDMKDRARKDQCPIWLEATTPLSKELYLKNDFEMVGDVVLGKGAVGNDGLAKKDGEGITIWSLFWRP